MENIRNVKYLKTWIVLGGTLFVFPFFIWGYSDTTTHPALTQEILNFYNKSYPERQIDSGVMEEIIQGSIDEDNGTRWLYHFYDPIYNRGLTLETNSSINNPDLAYIGGTNLKREWESSKEWAKNTSLQSGGITSALAGIFTDFFSSNTDYSWDRAIYDYTWGDEKRGLRGLGHILHLLEDATVPDHTRNDPHPPILDLGSPYEEITKQFTRKNITIQNFDQKINEFSNLSGFFNILAEYSNQNFFSEDTTLSSKYNHPIIEKEGVEILKNGIGYKFLYIRDQSNEIYPAARIIENFIDGTKEYTLRDPENFIIKDVYWSRLSKQAVLHGAGAVKLFFDEVEKEKQTKALYNKNRPWIGKQFDKITSGFAGIIFGTNPDSGSQQQTNAGISTPANETEPSKEVEIPQKKEPSNIQAAFPQKTQQITANTVVNNEQPNPTSLDTNQPFSQNTSSILPIAGVGGAPPKEPAPSDEISAAPAPQVEIIETTAASTTPVNSEQPIYIEPPIITEPNENTSVFATTTLIFSGTAEPDRIIREIITNASTTSDTDGAWTLTLVLPEGTTTLTFFAEDFAGYISSGTPRTIFITLPPEPVLNPPDNTPPPRTPVGPMPGPTIGDFIAIPMIRSPQSFVIMDDGAHALLADGNQISMLILESGEVRIVATGLENPTRMAVEASGETALVLEDKSPEFPGEHAGRLTRVNIRTGEKTVLATGFGVPRGIAIEREGETALVRAYGIYRVDLNLGSTTQLAYASINGDIAMEPGTTSALFLTEEVYQGRGVLKRIDLATNEITTVTESMSGSIRGDAIEVSPDGAFAFVLVAGGDSGITQINLKTGESAQIYSTGPVFYGSYSIRDLALYPDGSEISFFLNSPLEGLPLRSMNLANRTLTTIAWARIPHALAMSQEDNALVVASPVYFGWLFDRLKPDTGAGTRLKGFAQYASSFALLPNDMEVLTTTINNASISTIERIHLGTGQKATVAANITPQAVKIALEANGKTALISTVGKLLRIELETGTTTVISDQIAGAGPIAIEKDGLSALLVNSIGNTTALSRTDLASGTTTVLTSDMGVPGSSGGIGLDPDGKSAVIALRNALIRINLETFEITPISSQICGSTSIRNMVMEEWGETALVTHDACGLARVRLK